MFQKEFKQPTIKERIRLLFKKTYKTCESFEAEGKDYLLTHYFKIDKDILYLVKTKVKKI